MFEQFGMQRPIRDIRPVPGGHMQPNKILIEKPWMKRTSYKHRVQKKWLRRYGEAWIETIPPGEALHDIANNIIYVRQDDYFKLKHLMNNQAL